jgi:hypothetical protein
MEIGSNLSFTILVAIGCITWLIAKWIDRRGPR